MAARFESEFFDIDGQEYKLTIFDDSYTGGSVEQVLRGGTPGFIIKYEQDEDRPFQGIIASTLTATFLNDGGSFDTWLQSIPSITGENDITLTLQWKNSGTYQLEWAGVLMVDQIQLEDAPFPSIVQLTANDGLGFLKTKKSTLTETSGGVQVMAAQSIKDWLIEILGNTKSSQHWQSTDKFLRAWADFNPDGWGTNFSSSGLNILEYAKLYGAFDPNSINVINGSPEAYSNWTFLQSICMLFNARLCLANGEWHFWPVNQHILHASGTSYATEHKVYTKAGQPQSETSTQENEYFTRTTPQIGDAFTADRYLQLSGGIISHTIPHKNFRRARPYRGQEVLNNSIRTGNTSAINVNANGLGLVDFHDPRSFFTGAKFLIEGNIQVSRAADGSTTGPADIAQLRIKCNIDVGSRRYDPVNETWVTDQSTDRFFFVSSLGSISGGFDTNNSFSIQTVALPADSETMQVDIDADFINALGASLNTTFAAASPATDLGCFITTKNINDAFQNLLMFQGQSSLDNGEPFDQGQLVFGTVQDSGIQDGELFVQTTHNSATYQFPQGDWISSQSSTGAHINRLAVREAIALVQKGLAKRSGALKIPGSMRIPSPLMTIKSETGSEYFLTTSLSYSADDRIAEISRLKVTALDFTNVTDNGTSGEATDATGNDGAGTGADGGATDDNGTGGGSNPFSVGPAAPTSSDISEFVASDSTGIVQLTVASNAQPLTADQVDDSSSTNQFATASQLAQIATNQSNITSLKATVADGSTSASPGIYFDNAYSTSQSFMAVSNTGATVQAGGNTQVDLTESSPGTIAMKVEAGSGGSTTQVTAVTIAGSSSAQAATTTFNQPAAFSSTVSGIGLDSLDDVDTSGKSTGQVLQWGGSSWGAATVSGGGGSSDVVDDTSPQLGGNLDLNSNDITGTGNVNITGGVTASGSGNLGGLLLGSTGLLSLGAIQGTNLTGTGNGSITGTLTVGGDATFSSNLYASGLQFVGSGTNTIHPANTGGTQTDLQIESNGNVTIVLDDDDDETDQAFKIESGDGTLIWQVNESGVTSGLLTTATPTLSGAASTYAQSSSVSGISVSNHTSGRSYEAAIFNSSGTEQTSNPVTVDSSGNITFTAPATAATGYELRIAAADVGKFKSPQATATFEVTPSRTFTYWRVQGVDSSGNASANKAAWVELDFYTGANATGTETPTTDATSETSISGVTISAGTVASFSGYDAYRAFDGTTHGTAAAGSMWWTLGNSNASLVWIQVQFSSAQTFESLKLTVNNNFNDATHLIVKGSNTGSFSGEEVSFGLTAIDESGSAGITTVNF